MRTVQRGAMALGAALALVMAAGAQAAAAEDCKFEKFAELPIRLRGNRVLIEAEINGRPALFFADTGAFSSMIFADAAQEYGLPINDSGGTYFEGIGGEERARIAHLKTLKLGSYAASDVSLFAASARHGEKVVGLIGRDILTQGELEIDIAGGEIRMFHVSNCKDVNLAYWTQTPAVADLRRPPLGDKAYVVGVTLNGRPTNAEVDSGAPTSFVTLGAAQIAGVSARDGVADKEETGGLGGGHTIAVRTATFDKLAVGDETVSHVKLRIADLFRNTRTVVMGSNVAVNTPGLPSMLIGADFLRAHRVLFAPSQQRMYFTYNGGTIFQEIGPARIVDAPAASPVAPPKP